MQRMERLAANVYKNQVRGFGGNEIALKLQKAYENEKEHAETLAKVISKLNGRTSRIDIFFGLASTIAGMATLLLGKISLLKIDTWIERRAVQDYSSFVSRINYSPETLNLLNRIIDDEKRHIENWQDSIEILKKDTGSA